jgi:hypothetical protein
MIRSQKVLQDKMKKLFGDEEVQQAVLDLIHFQTQQIAFQTVYQMPAGELIDKFIVCHVRMWNLEEEITSGENVSDDTKVAMASRRLRVVNAERARLREELNRRLSGYELGTEKSYMQRIDTFREIAGADGEKEE